MWLEKEARVGATRLGCHVPDPLECWEEQVHAALDGPVDDRPDLAAAHVGDVRIARGAPTGVDVEHLAPRLSPSPPGGGL